MKNLQDLITPGHYARTQVLSKDRVIAWSHRSRFMLARQLVEPYAGGRLLDYGCGEGTFLALVHDLFANAAGTDANADEIAKCRERFAAKPGVEFVIVDKLKDEYHGGAFKVVCCFEVLEHCTESVAGEVLYELRRLVADDGRVIISVPIETNLSLVGKQVVRALAQWRGHRGQRETYRFGEFCKMVLAREGTAIERPLRSAVSDSGTYSYHGHKGFNWRTMRRRLDGPFVVERICFSPLGRLGALVGSQAWFVCSPRPY
ncbi:MAG: class I SAM-dependent methyltransferase [Candidatus Binataceae bacterium]